MIEKIDHIGIAVNNAEKSAEKFKNLFKTGKPKSETVESQKVKITRISIGEVDIEFLEPISDDSPISKFINKKGQGVHHIALKVKNIDETEKNLKDSGIKLVFEKYQLGGDKKKINFIHPRGMNGLLIEICE